MNREKWSKSKQEIKLNIRRNKRSISKKQSTNKSKRIKTKGIIVKKKFFCYNLILRE